MVGWKGVYEAVVVKVEGLEDKLVGSGVGLAVLVAAAFDSCCQCSRTGTFLYE